MIERLISTNKKMGKKQVVLGNKTYSKVMNNK
jgi:hypothetical protein